MKWLITAAIVGLVGCGQVSNRSLEEKFGFPANLILCSGTSVKEFTSEDEDEFDVFIRTTSSDTSKTIETLEQQLRGTLYPTTLPPPRKLSGKSEFSKFGTLEFSRISTDRPYEIGLVCRRSGDELRFWFFRRFVE